MNKRIVMVSGGFDPIHKGHIYYMNGAASLRGPGGLLVVGLNSDEWLRRKKGQEFMSFEDRFAVTSSLRVVDMVLPMNDDDDSACDLIRQCWETFPDAEFIFANGGDRSSSSVTPEAALCKELGVTLAYGVGGEDKANSSSWILDKWNGNK